MCEGVFVCLLECVREFIVIWKKVEILENYQHQNVTASIWFSEIKKPNEDWKALA